MSHRRHDRFLRWALDRPEDARDFFQTLLSARIREAVDWSSLRPAPNSPIGEELKQLRPDLVFQARCNGAPSLLYVFLEHQSGPYERMALRMLGVSHALLQRWCSENGSGGKLPRIVPIVFYHGSSAWNEPLDLAGLSEPVPAEGAMVGRLGPALRYELIDLSETSDHQLLELAMSAVGRLVLMSLKHGRDHRDLVGFLARVAELIREISQTPQGEGALVTVLRYLLSVNRETKPKDLMAAVERRLDKEVAMTLKTLEDKLIELGRQEGRQEGREEGRLEGARSVLLRQLENRFGQLDDSVRGLVSRAGEEEIELWSLRVLRAGDLSQVWGDG